MEIIICQTCGSILACTETKCSNCNAVVSADSVFTVSPIQGSSTRKQSFSFFEDEAATVSASQNNDDFIEPDLYVFSRPTIASAFSTKVTPESHSTIQPAVSNAPQTPSTQIDSMLEESDQQTVIPQSRVLRFTNKHLTIVAAVSAIFVVIMASIILFQNYEISIEFFNPFSFALAWFMSLPVSVKFMVAALSFVAFAIAAFVASYVLFSPNGKMNAWEKQKYIPSQFKAEHANELRLLSKTAQAGSLPLGVRNEWRPWNPFAAKTLSLPSQIRETSPHVLIVGAGDTGKTRLMAKMILHDITSKQRAVVVIDSDGKLSDLITRWSASQSSSNDLVKRITLLEPNHKSNSLGYNPLQMPEDGDLQSAANAIVFGFKAIYTEPAGAQNQWSQQTANILRNAAMLLIANGRTLSDLPSLLNDNDFRDVLLDSIEKRKNEKTEFVTLLETWATYKRLARSDQWIPWVEPILNRVTPMLSDVRIRSILTKQVSDLDLKKIIEERRVLIVKVPKGKLDQNGCLLGSLIVTGIKQAAISLSNSAHSENAPIALYLDELDNFVEKETFQSFTQDTEELKIGLIGTLRSFQILPEDFRNQIVGGFNTLCCFTLSKKDADMVGPQIFRVDGKKVKTRTLQNWFNPVNSSPQFEQVTDEEKLNSDRLVGLGRQKFFCYRVGTAAAVFSLKAPNFEDVAASQVDNKLIAKMRQNL